MTVKNKLLLLNIIICSSLLLVLYGSLTSFQKANKGLKNAANENIERVIKNAETTRALSTIFVDIELLAKTYLGKQKQLQQKRSHLLRTLTNVENKLESPRLLNAVNVLKSDLSHLCDECSRLNIHYAKMEQIENDASNALNNLAQLISSQIVDIVIKGEDSSVAEQQLALVVGYRETILLLGRSHHSKQTIAHSIKAVDSLLLRLSTLTASSPSVARYGERLVSLMSKYRTILPSYASSRESVQVALKALAASKELTITELRRYEATIADSSQIIGNSLEQVLATAKKSILLQTLLVTLLIILTTTWYIQRDINKPLHAITGAIDKLKRGSLDSELSLKRKDEWQTIEIALNEMARNLHESRHKLEQRVEERTKELKETEAKYRGLVEECLVGVFLIQDNRVVYANKRASEISGYGLEEIYKKPAFDFVAAGDRKRVEQIVEERFSGQRKGGFNSFTIVHADGHMLSVEATATTFHYMGKPSLIGTIQDVSQRKKAEEERLSLEKRLQQARKMEAIGTLAGGVAHDLNNILMGLVSYPDLLLHKIPSHSPIRDTVQTIKDAGCRATAIVKDLLTLARRGVQHSEVLSLNSLVSEHLMNPEHLALVASKANIELKVSLSESLLNVRVSPIHVQKCLMNLLLNAFEAMPDGGTIELITGNRSVEHSIGACDEIRSGEYVVLTISDEGIGIDESDLSHIFEPFYTKKVMGRSGSGLGLAVVWGTMKDHGGYVDVLKNDRGGTSFELFFPITKDERVVKKSSQDLELYKGHEAVLVVDDEENQRELASLMLTKMGYEVETATTGREAVKKVQSKSYDLVILDMIIEPDFDGLDTYEEILKTKPRQKAIIVSGYSESNRVRETQKLGAGNYVAKPYLMETLCKAVREELDNKVI